MSRQAELMAISNRKGVERWRFYLQNASQGLLWLDEAPDGWKSGKFELKRDARYMGLFRSLSFNDLTFLKAARDFLQSVYEGQGINAKVTFGVQRMDDSTGDFIEYFTGKVDYTTYKVDETGVKVQIIDTSFAEKVKNRENTPVNVRQRTSIEGYEVPAFTDEEPYFTLPDYEIVARAIWGDRASGHDDSTLDNHYVPLFLEESEFTETQHQDPDVDPNFDGGAGAMFFNSTADRTMDISINISGIVTLNSYQVKAQYRLILFVNGANEKEWEFKVENTQQIVFAVNDTDGFTVTTGQNFYLQGSLSHSGTTLYSSVFVEVTEVLSNIPGGVITGYPYYEAFLRTLQLITDDNDVLQSEKFGRTDSEVVTYAADGQLGHITRGAHISGQVGFNGAISLKLSEIFASLSACFNLGMGIETVSGRDKVVIEDLSYFFDSEVIVDLSSRIREESIGKEVWSELHYNQVEVGYNSFEYLTTGGLAEYNTKMAFSTVISVLENKLDLISKYRADTTGIVLLRQNAGNPEDAKGVEDIFLVDTLRSGGGFRARTDEGFTLITGGADVENSFNLLLSPKRNLLRNGNKIRAGLEKDLGTYLRFQAADKNTTLATQLTTESDLLSENADVLVNDLEEPFFLPEFYTLECEMRYEDLTAILTNPKGLIKLSDIKYGWIWDLSLPGNENKVSLKLLRANLYVITPT